MISKLPKWAWVGASALTFSAGLINAVAFLGFTHGAVTHVTGEISGLSIALSKADWLVSRHLLSVVLAFFFGSMVCGVIVRDSHLKIGRRYGGALILESFLLCASVAGFKSNSINGEILASLACGLQNAMASTYSGAIIRTTHMTGIVTDLGSLIGQWISGMEFDYRKACLYLLLLISFLTGGCIGVFIFKIINYFALLLPAIITGFAGFLYILLRWVKLSRSELC